MFAAVSKSGVNNRIMISIDAGDNWKIIQSPADNNWESVCWGGPNGQQKFVDDFVAAWNKVMNLDRFDLQ